MKKKHIFPENGLSGADLMGKLETLKSADARWDMGKVFGFVYHPGKHYARISEEYLNAFLYESTLNPTTFPSLHKFEKDVTRMAVELMHGDDQVVGNVTSGGSESIFLALKTARETADEKEGEAKHWEIILPETAHPAFLKACNYLSLKAVIVPVGEDKRADAKAMQDAINSKTIMLICSAPCFPYGVVDPVHELAGLARKHKLLLHVDACMGGFMLPFLEDLAYPVPGFDFRIKGVSSISLDAHKYAYSPKGVSVILYRNRKLRRKQFFIHADWPGGIFASTTFMGTKSGGALAGCWAIMNHMGREGYRIMAEQVMKTSRSIAEGIEEHKSLHVIGKPDMSLLAFTSDSGDIFSIGDALASKGWHLDRLQFPDALHLTITQLNIGKEEEFLKDLEEIVKNLPALKEESRTVDNAVKTVRALTGILPGPTLDWLARRMGAMSGSGEINKKMPQSAIYGISSTLKNRKNVSKLLANLLDGMYS